MAFVPIKKYITDLEIKKSKFIGIGVPISSTDDAREILKELKKEYMDSRHVCYAFVWGKKSTHMGMSDDGEPSGTAGRPMLEVVKGTGYENLLVAAVRYFGGVKLGTGGLVKAYTEITKMVVDNIEVEEVIERIEVEIIIPYQLYDSVKITIEAYSGKIVEEIFLTDISLRISIIKSTSKDFDDKLMNLSNGKLSIY